MGVDSEIGGVFLRYKGEVVRHLERHQGVPLDHWYVHTESGREFDVRELPQSVIGKLEPSQLAQADRAIHKQAIRSAIDADHDFKRVPRASASESTVASPAPTALALFEVQYDDVAFSSSKAVAGFECGPKVIAKFNEALRAEGLLVAPFVRVLGAKVSEDDSEGSEDDCKYFTSVTLLVEAKDDAAAESLDPPEALLQRALAEIERCSRASLESEGNWEVLETIEHEPDAAVKKIRAAPTKRRP